MTAEIRTYSNDQALVSERRKQIMESALKLFLQKGYKGTSMREIAKACGLSEGALYRYIGAKDDILHLICVGRAQGAESLANYRRGLGDISPKEALAACMRLCFGWAETSRDYNLFFNREIRNFSHEDRQILMRDQAAMVRFFERLLIEGIEKGEFQIESPVLVAHDILMKVHDWGLRRWFLKEHTSIDEYTRIHIDLLLKAIQSPSATESSQIYSSQAKGCEPRDTSCTVRATQRVPAK